MRVEKLDKAYRIDLDNDRTYVQRMQPDSATLFLSSEEELLIDVCEGILSRDSKMTKAAKILDMILEEIPKTMGRLNIELLMEDIMEAREELK